ncbi:MAG: glycosyltransferase family 39 protein [Anaerolineae bacterium]|nr:glycosyltransferase family 39 protein [Anaerolineae bacterium]
MNSARFRPAYSLVLLAAFGLRCINLSGRPLWYDEAFAILYAALTPVKMIYGTVTPIAGAGASDVHPLLYYFSLHAWMRGAGSSPFAARFLSVLLGVLTVALLWRLADWVFDRRTGLAVALLAAVNPFHVAYSQEARMYALLAFAAVAAAGGMLRALESRGEGEKARPSFKWWALYAAAAALTLYAHNLGAFVLIALHLLVLTQRRWRRRLLELAAADLGALLLFAPWLIGVLPGQLGFVQRGYWLAPPGAGEAVRALMLPLLTFYEPAPSWLLALGLFTGLLLLVLLITRAARARSRAGWFLWLCWAPLLLLMLVSLWRPLYLERALLPAALFYLLAIGWLLARGGLPRPLRVALVALLLLATSASLVNHYTYARFPRPPFEQMDDWLQQRLSPGEVVLHDNKLTFFPAYLYDPTLPHAFCPDLAGSSSDTLARPTQEALGLFATPISQTVTPTVGGVWYVAFDRTWVEYRALGYDDGPNRAWLRAHCRQEGPVSTLADLEVYHFVDCEAGP